MAKNYRAVINDKYEAKVINNASGVCLFDEQKYDLYYDKIRNATKKIISNCNDIINAMDKILSDPQTGKAPASYCKRIKQNALKIKLELTENRNNLGVKLDNEFRKQIKSWIAWCKKQDVSKIEKL